MDVKFVQQWAEIRKKEWCKVCAFQRGGLVSVEKKIKIKRSSGWAVAARAPVRGKLRKQLSTQTSGEKSH